MSVDQVVVLRDDDPLAFVADACAAAAEAAAEPRSWRPQDVAMIDLYAELVVAYARLVRPRLGGVRLAVIDHLTERVAQARRGEIATPLVDIVDRLHSEVTAQPALA